MLAPNAIIKFGSSCFAGI